MSIAEEDALAKAAGRDTSGLEHWMDHLTHFMDNGVDGFKLDPATSPTSWTTVWTVSSSTRHEPSTSTLTSGTTTGERTRRCTT